MGNPIKYSDPSGHMVSECGDDGSECSGTTQLELDQNAQNEALWLATNEELKCKAGNSNHCSYAENHPAETATFIIASMVTMGLADPVSIGGAINALEALGWQTAAVCLRTPLCAMLIGTGGAGITSSLSTKPNSIGATGDVGENWLAQFGGTGPNRNFFPTSQGARYVDRLVNNMAYESKVGYVSLTEDISRQVAKDVELLETGSVSSVSWVFFPSPVTGAYGPSTPLYNLLVNNGIKVFFVQP